MSTNQTKAITLAEQILHGRVHPLDLPDDDWTLLLLAAGECCVASPALTLSCKVLNHAQHHTGYFESARRQSLGHHPYPRSELTL
jgi:hypothetical protein